VYRLWYTGVVSDQGAGDRRREFPPQTETFARTAKRVPAIFFRTEAGGEPVREWLRSLPRDDRKRIGKDIATVEFGWPVGMPVCRAMGAGLCEVRTHLMQHRLARVLFYIDAKGRLVLLHGFIKKSRKTPNEDLDIARKNKQKHERGTT
jgi:phage-related protein